MTNISREEKGKVLERIKDCTNRGSYTVPDREDKKNIKFREKYGLDSENVKQILCSLTKSELTKKGIDDNSLRHGANDVYFFECTRKLILAIDDECIEVSVCIYIKCLFRIIKQDNNLEHLLVISFHENEY